MGSRLVLPALLLAALAASGLFWWLSGRAPSPRVEPHAPAAAVEADAADARPAELATPTAPAATPLAADRTVVEERTPRAARVDRPDRPDRNGPRVRGRVVDREGAPVASATILATDQPGISFDLEPGAIPWARHWSATSDADGRFELVGPPAGNLRVAARAAGFAPFERGDLTIPPDDEVELPPIVMSLGAILSGHVLDPDGRAVPGAELVRIEDADQGGFVVLGGRREPVAVTGADGSFRIDQLACGQWSILVQTEDHPDRTFQGLAERPGEEISGLEFVLEPGTTISGRVSGVPDGEKVVVRAGKVVDEGFFVGSRSRRAEVDAAGRFVLEGLEIGALYDLGLRSADEDRGGFGFFGRSRSEAVRARAGDTGVVIPYQPEGALVFRVLDAATREPLTDFEVEAGVGWPMPVRDEEGKRRTFFPDGLVRAGDMRPRVEDDRIQLAIHATGYREYRRDDIALASGQELDLGQILLEPVPLVRVTVLDVLTGEPVPGALVNLAEQQPEGHFTMSRTIDIDTENGVRSHISSGGRNARTDADGVAELTSFEGKTCVLTIRSDDHAPFELSGLFLPSGQVVERTVELTPGGEVVVTVLDAEGAPMAGARVRHRPPGSPAGMFQDVPHGGGGRNVTDSDGRVRFEKLQAGVHGFRLGTGAPAGGLFLTEAGDAHVALSTDESFDDDEWSRIEVVEGSTHALTLHASPVGSLVGRIREGGRVLAGATLQLAEKEEDGQANRGPMMSFMGDGGGRRARTDGDGNYRYDDVEEGIYTLTISHPTRRMSDEIDVEIEAGENELHVDLPVSILEGRITGLDGEPLPGLTVRAERVREDEGVRAQFFAIRVESDGDDTVVSTGQELGDATTTDADGRYVLRGVQPDVDLVVTAEGDAVQEGRTEALRVGPDEVRRDVDFVLEPAGSILVEALLPDGAPARFCVVRASYLGSGESEASVEPEFGFIQSGSTRLTGLRPGPWRVNVQRAGPGLDGDEGVDREVEVKAGEVIETTIRL